VFFKTLAECQELTERFGFTAEPTRNRIKRSTGTLQGLRIPFAKADLSTYVLARRICSWFGQTRYCLLWVTEFGIWSQTENLHLYYLVRRAYRDQRAIFEAPGHAFLSYEEPDLITFIDLMLQLGWGGFLVGTPNSRHITISHDEWVMIESDEELDSVIPDLDELGLSHQRVNPRQRSDA
jgi:hypothetical protein